MVKSPKNIIFISWSVNGNGVLFDSGQDNHKVTQYLQTRQNNAHWDQK